MSHVILRLFLGTQEREMTELSWVDKLSGTESIKGEAYNELLDKALECVDVAYHGGYDVAAFDRQVEGDYHDYMVTHFSGAPFVTSMMGKFGKWKYRKAVVTVQEDVVKAWASRYAPYPARKDGRERWQVECVPTAAHTAVSVIRQGIEAGVLEKGMGKSALEKRIRETREVVSEFAKAEKLCDSLIGKKEKITTTEWEYLVNRMKDA
jgi:hypothetical protein